ncbi:MAG: hypothetical protein QW334_01660, partial [Thermofilum sp.]
EAAAGGSPPPSPEERWAQFKKLLRSLLTFPSIYVLVDGLDGAPETIADPSAIARFLEPLFRWSEEWAEERVFLKAFLPAEARPLLEGRFPNVFASAHTIHWTPDLLAEVIRRRVYVATEGSFGSLDALASPALRDIETLLAKTVIPIPREMLVLTRRVLEEHVQLAGYNSLIGEEEVEKAIQWYLSNSRFQSRW